MKINYSRTVVTLLALMFANTLVFADDTVYVDEPVSIPAPARVTDLTDTLSLQTKSDLSKKLEELETSKGSQIAVLMVPTTGSESIEEFANRVFHTWGLGRKGVDDGVLLVVAKADRKIRVEVGRGLEGSIPDAYAKHITADVIAPYLKHDAYSEGLTAGVDSLIGYVSKESLPTPAETKAQLAKAQIDNSLTWALGFLGLMAGIAILFFVRAARRAAKDHKDRESSFAANEAALHRLRDNSIREAAARRQTEGTRATIPGSRHTNTAAIAAGVVAGSRVRKVQVSSNSRGSSSSSSRRRDEDDSSSSISFGSSISGSDSSSYSAPDTNSISPGGGDSAGGGASDSY